jgi:hypothetical protein
MFSVDIHFHFLLELWMLFGCTDGMVGFSFVAFVEQGNLRYHTDWTESKTEVPHIVLLSIATFIIYCVLNSL